MSLQNIFDSISDFNLVLIIYVLIGVGIFFYVFLCNKSS
jgi:hypothetical protein